MNLRQERIDRERERNELADIKIRETLPDILNTHLTGVDVAVRESFYGVIEITKTVVLPNDKTESIHIYVSRKQVGDNLSYYTSTKHAIKVTMNSSMSYDAEKLFNRTWNGNKLRKDILDEKFDPMVIVQTVKRALEWFDERAEWSTQRATQRSEGKERLERLAGAFTASTGKEWGYREGYNGNGGDAIKCEEIEVCETSSKDDDNVHIKIPSYRKVSKETALKIAHLLLEDVA